MISMNQNAYLSSFANVLSICNCHHHTPLGQPIAYVDTNLIGTGKVTQAAILGLKGGVWAQSAGFAVSIAPSSAQIGR